MEPQTDSTQFTGTPQSESTPAPEPKSGKSSKLFPILAIVIILGLAGGGAFFFMQSSDANKKIDTLTSERDAAKTSLGAFKEATGVDDPADVVTGGGKFDLSGIANLVSAQDLILFEGAFVMTSTDGKFEIASFMGIGAQLYFYRTLPNGEWKKSDGFSREPALCSEVTDEEIAAFADIVECEESDPEPNEEE